MKKLYFVTGNENKRKEVQDILSSVEGLQVEAVKLDLPELQGDPLEISREKCLTAIKELESKYNHRIAVIVEDTGLCFHALKGLPGPYIKWFLEKLGHEGLNKMLDGFQDYSAYAQCILSLGFTHDKTPIVSFDGRTEGKIGPAKGSKHFGWDPIFTPQGFDQTYAELDKDIKNKISHRFKAFDQLKTYIAEHPSLFESS